MTEIEKAERYDCIKEICERRNQEEGIDLSVDHWENVRDEDFN